MKYPPRPSRRQLLGSLGLAAGAIAIGDVVLHGVEAHADNHELSDQNLLVFITFEGAWDTLLCLDPRDHTIYGSKASGTGIYTGLEEVRVFDPITSAMLDLTDGKSEKGLYQAPGSNLAFGPAMVTDVTGSAVTSPFGDLHEDMCVIRGVDMGTLTHEVGKRYFMTGKFPRGVLPSGSALGTWIAAQTPDSALIPNLVLGGCETINEGLNPKASGLEIASIGDLQYVLKKVGATVVPDNFAQAIADAQASDSCVHKQLSPGGMIEAYRAGWTKAGELVDGNLFSDFNFVAQPTGDIAALYQAFGINPNNPAADLAGPKGRCATAAQAIVKGLSRAVSLRINPQSIDTHFDDWQTTHVQRLRPCFEAVASLIQFLKSQSFWDRTTVVISSEFARTPKLNNQNGRDHHLCNTIVLAGNGIKGNQVIGASGPDSYDVVPFDFDSQAPDETAPIPIRPADVHATICKAMDISYEHIENQEPKLLTEVLSETS
jgi:hypothetical protein